MRKKPAKAATEPVHGFDEWPDFPGTEVDTDQGLDQNEMPQNIPEPELEAEDTDEKGKRTKRRTTECIVRNQTNLYRRAYSETQLMDAVGYNFLDGESYHCITGGDVDSLSYLKVVIRQQPLDYCLFSTWCMAGDDILQFEEWLEDGKIKHLDAYVGEIFPSSYKFEWMKLRQMQERYGGRLVVFRNHCKIYAGYGPKFAFGIETSANINTNPRTENGCITIGREIFDFYYQFFKGIKSIIKDDRLKEEAAAKESQPKEKTKGPAKKPTKAKR